MNIDDDKYIIITTISAPTESVKCFSELINYKLIVIGDRKTPQDWKLDNCRFISLKEQNKNEFLIASKLPINHYSRKMIGYLTAISSGAKVIIDTDDDNKPKHGWGFPCFEGCFDVINDDKGFVNIYNLFTDINIWPRGFPVNRINTTNSEVNRIETYVQKASVGVWQGLADEDPDVDAIYRLVCNKPCYFNERSPIVLGKGTISPFNSQNTAFRKEFFPLLYLPAFVSFRFTDILRGLIAQPIMWLYGYNLGFTDATVTQFRNEHNLLKDFESEIPMYLLSERIIDIVKNKLSSNLSISQNLFNAYDELFRQMIVKKEELELLDLWLKEF